jgi:hypothetical protein
MFLGSEEWGVEPADYPLARERRHPGLCLVDRVLPSGTYTLKDKVLPLEGVRSPTPAPSTGVIARVSVRARRRRNPRDALTLDQTRSDHVQAFELRM